MQGIEDYYEILQVHHLADSEVIDAAYRRLAVKYHPDNGGSIARLVELNRAYEILGNPTERARFDAARRSELNPPSTREPESPPADESSAAQRATAWTHADNRVDVRYSTSYAVGSLIRSLRWLLIPVVAVFASVLAGSVARYLIGLKFDPDVPPSLFAKFVAGVLWGGSVGAAGVLGAVIAAPNYRRAVAVVMGGFYVLGCGALVGQAIQREVYYVAFTCVMMAAAALAAALAIRDAAA